MPSDTSYFFPTGIPTTRKVPALKGRIFSDSEPRSSLAPTLASIVAPTLPSARLAPLAAALPSKDDPFNWFWGSAAFRQHITQELAIAARHPVHSLIVGESGTGKEIIAREIHRLRAKARFCDPNETPFVAINCAAIPESLAESLLFGHERGAFTSAREKQSGKFEQAQDGVLFLDEIQNLSLNLQAKLLRVIQFGELDRLGSKKPIKINCKIVAACNVPLEILTERGLFRKDLYFRLNVLPIYLPALRDRMEDLPALAQAVIFKLCAQYAFAPVALSDSAMKTLLAYDWPGNLRELEHALLHGCLKSNGERIETKDLPQTVRQPAKEFLSTGKWDLASLRH